MHSAIDSDQCSTILYFVVEVVGFHDFVGDESYWRPHPFWLWHGATEIEVTDVNSHETSVVCRDDAVEK